MIRRSFLLAASLLLIPSGPVAASGDAWLGSLAEARKLAAANNKLILVDLYADWCGWCKELDKKVFATPEFGRWADREAVLLRVDTEDGSDGTMLDRRYGGGSLPTTLLMTPDFAVVARIQGFIPVAGFIARLDNELAQWKRLDAEFPKLASSRDAVRLEQLADALRAREDGSRAAKLYRRVVEVSAPAPIKRADLWTRAADAHRLAAEYGLALEALDRAKPDLGAAGEAIANRAELLRSEIAHEKGDCASAKSGLEVFLREHPTSEFSRSARHLLNLIASGQSPACA